MADHTITLTDQQVKCLSTITNDVGAWITKITTDRALVASKEIAKINMQYCNENNIEIATGLDAQVLQAFSLGCVKTSAEQNADATKNINIIIG